MYETKIFYMFLYILLSALPIVTKLSVFCKTFSEFVYQYPGKWKTILASVPAVKNWKSSYFEPQARKQFRSNFLKRKRKYPKAVSDCLTSFNIELAVVKKKAEEV